MNHDVAEVHGSALFSTRKSLGTRLQLLYLVLWLQVYFFQVHLVELISEAEKVIQR